MKSIIPFVAVIGLFIGQISAHAQCPEAVDLGLSVKWASFNVGAYCPEEVGDYYAWGEIRTKKDYGDKTYRWYNSSFSSLLKYNTNPSCGSVDNKTVLELKDDVAHTRYGGQWRMPTKKEWDELMENCNWLWIEINGVSGYEVTGMNGNSIFLPVGGKIRSEYKTEIGAGYYWSSSLCLEETNDAQNLYFMYGYIYNSRTSRTIGMLVRPVSD